MARPPSFDRRAVVLAAMEVFWQLGYQRASIKVLGEAMGLKPGSIYAAFGSKEGLFREVLEAYVGQVGAKVSLDRVGPAGVLEGWFAEHIAAATATPEGRGCLLLNSAFEVAAVDSPSADLIRHELELLESFFEACVRAARAQRPAPPGGSRADAKATARALVSTLGGISMLSRAGSSRSDLEEVARVALMAV